MRTSVRFARDVIGRRGTSLLFLALVDMVYAYSLADPPPSVRRTPTFVFLASVAPLWLWSLLWALVGFICFVNAFLTHDRVGFAAAMGIKVLWSGVFAAAAIEGVERAYASVAIWLGFAGWLAVISTWPEPPTWRVGSDGD